MEIVIALAAIVIGFVIGRVPTCEPYLFLELGTDVYAVMRKKHVTFRVKVENLLSHD